MAWSGIETATSRSRVQRANHSTWLPEIQQVVQKVVLSKRSTSQRPQNSSGSIPAWVKLTALVVVLVLAYLIYTNMEPNAVSNIPSIPNKVQV
ncbi:hypothetical protein ElyMa_005941700 [Elysia marginata]|uniref:LEM domain-containing protein n=1 Tax=Elysia marginata TaxID=1093978 RepID=A0AAV4GCG9_9GAST|nr:hypothetical protein ElyMa_005941700 [Elysia marginata]